MAGTIDPWAEVTGWQAMLDRHRALFEPVAVGTAVGLLPRAAADASAGEMMAWVRQPDGMAVERRPFSGFGECGVHLLFVAEPAAAERLHARLDDNPLGAMKLAVRDGSILLYVLKPKTQLLDDGLEDFLEVLGLAFLGACR